MSTAPMVFSAQNGATYSENIAIKISASGAVISATAQATSSTFASIYEKSNQTTGSLNPTYTRNQAAGQAAMRTAAANHFTLQSTQNSQSDELEVQMVVADSNGNSVSEDLNANIDDSTIATAQQEVSADGYWGVQQTSDRMINFAEAISGGDPTKLATLENAIVAGYNDAQQEWGGALPPIAQQTLAATIQGLNQWAAGSQQSA
jgi:hypothetical protein